VGLSRIALVTGLIIIIIFSGCIERRDHPIGIDYIRYFPLNEGNRYVYSGPLGTAEVTDEIGRLYTFTYYDTLGNITGWRDYSISLSRIYLQNIIPNDTLKKPVFFEPGIPFSPWINLIGDTLLYDGAEVRADSVNSHYRIRVEYEILDIEDIITPAGTFDDCIKVSMNYRTLGNGDQKYFDGETIWWYAADVGIVKYEGPEESGELLEARVDKTTYPKD